MKLSAWLLFTLSLFSLPFSASAQASFPARGFSPILDDIQAEAKLKNFKDFFFTPSKNKVFHQGYLYRFEFTHYPRTGSPIVHYGMLSGPAPESSRLRIDLYLNAENAFPYTSFFLSRDSNHSQLWQWSKSTQSTKEVLARDWLLPWVEGINHAPFDLLMPFVKWPYQYEKSGRVCGRPAHLFLFTPPNESSFSKTDLSSVRLAIDDTYNAPLRIEHRDGGILPNRTFSLQSFKKVADRWVVKTIDSKDRDSGSKTRFELKAVAHGLDLPESTFQKSGLAFPVQLSSIVFDKI